jgi:ADP-heptose:LPS heptosyltransferase
MKIIISPYSSKPRDVAQNAKNFPYWKQLVRMLQPDHEIIQVGIGGEDRIVDDFRTNLKPQQLIDLLKECDLFVSVDNFFPHFANHYGRNGIVIFAKSDPRIFGYPSNVNILKDRKYLRQLQFWDWHTEKYDRDAFVKPEIVCNSIMAFCKRLEFERSMISNS